MDRRTLLSSGLALLVCAVLSSPAFATEKTSKSKIQWQKDLRSAHRAAIKSGKPILIVFGAEWCGFCHKLERETLNESETSNFVNSQFITVKLDLDKDVRAAKILGVKSLPASIVVNTEADLLGRIVGYQDSAKYTKNLRQALRIHNQLQQVAAQAPAE